MVHKRITFGYRFLTEVHETWSSARELLLDVVMTSSTHYNINQLYKLIVSVLPSSTANKKYTIQIVVRLNCQMVARDSSAGIGTYYRLDGPGIELVRAGLSAPVLTGPRTQPASYTMANGSLSRG